MPGKSIGANDNKQEIEKARILRRRRFLTVLMPLILLFECGVVWNIGYLLLERFPMTGTIIMFLGLLFFSCIAILSAMQYLRRTKVRIMLFLVIFVIGCVANFFCGLSDVAKDMDGNGALSRVFLSYCAAVAEFFPSRGGYDTPTGDFAWTKILFYYLSCVFSISIVIAIWGGKITNRWRLFLLRFLRQKRSVFWCNVPSNKEFMLATDIYQNSIDEHCIFSAEESLIENASDLQSDLNYHGHLLCLRKPMQFHRVCLGATRHFFLTDDYYWNIRMANQLCEKYRSIPHKKLDFFIRISDDVRKVWAEQWAESIQQKSDIDIHLINEATLLARILAGKNPLLKSPKVRIDEKTGKASGQIRILLLGFGELGKAILRETICDGQFLKSGADGRIPFSVDVVDRDEAAFDLYGAFFEDAMKEYNVRFIRQDVCSSDFFRQLELNLSSYNRIILAFSDDTLNLETSSRIKTIARMKNVVFGNSVHASARMMIRISDSITAKVLRDPTQNSQSEDVFFGVLDECYCRDVIINETLDRRAKRINRNHIALLHPEMADDLDEEREWKRTSMFRRERDRSCASGMRNLLLLAGMDESTFDPETWKKRISDERFLNTLAETEHLRWCAFQLTHGVRRWPMSEIGEDAKKPNDIREHMRHAALTDYKNLPDVDRRFGRDPEQLQSNNRRLVQSVPDIMQTK